MRAAVIHGPRDVRVEERPDPKILTPADAVIRVVAACVCGSDLWPYRGVRETRSPHPIGHELVGVVEEVGADVTVAAPGDFVIAPFSLSDGTCQSCRAGFTSACDHVTMFGGPDRDGHPVDGAQGEYVRMPLADGSLVRVPGPVDDALVPDLLTLSDVMSTGHHAAVSAGVGPGSTVVVVGDGAVGLSGVLAASRLGAERVIAVSRHADRAELASEFGATDVVAERGDEGIAAVRDLLGGDLADSALECVGTKESMRQALGSVHGGGRVGYVGVPAGGSELPIGYLFSRNLTVGGGMAPARAYIPELLPDVLSRAIEPGRVFDLELGLEDVAEAYAAMDERRAIKVLLRP
ncbi:zinc-dependent alcohol dehydrogenase family protein [Luteimicrobium sp. DT211]|uniref:zinc-dependent alcohol dehydrogenase family protein n=1 Tax=Luteimicrobium sp. DT211 TaxID=3393412 RepID=UPI003CF47D11